MVFFSVIIPNYNHAQFLKRRIDSVLNQTYQNFELIILDDASTDESQDIINSYRDHPKISHIIFNKKNTASPFRQWKKGIELANAEWIWIAESDDEAMPEFLESATHIINNYPRLGIYFTNSIYENILEADAGLETTAILNKRLYHLEKWDTDYLNIGRKEVNECLRSYNSIVNASSVVMRKSALLPLNTHLTKTNYSGDWLVYIQIASKYDVFYNSHTLNKYRRHKNSLLNKEYVSWKRKRDYFIIFNYLLSLPIVTDKRELIRFYILKYLGFGLKSDSFSSIINTLGSYITVNPLLAVKIIMQIILYKIKGIKEL